MLDVHMLVLRQLDELTQGKSASLMLNQMGVKTIILAGFTADICIQFTTMDGFLREYAMKVPSDCKAAVLDEFKQQTLDYMQRALKCDVSPSTCIL